MTYEEREAAARKAIERLRAVEKRAKHPYAMQVSELQVVVGEVAGVLAELIAMGGEDHDPA